MKQIRASLQAALVCLGFVLFCSQARAENPVRDVTTVAYGASQVAGGVLALPVEMLKGAAQSFPFGILAGALRGTVKTFGGVLGGAFNIAKGAAPYAKYAALL